MPRPEKNKDYGKRVLQLGCEDGLDVWELQIKLIGWGSGSDNDGIGGCWDPVRVTGTFDATTRDAVMRFQKAHKLAVTGTADVPLFYALDREPAYHPVLLHDLKCPCAHGVNDGPILCRCTGLDGATPPKPKKHEEEGKCDGFGKARFAKKYLLDDQKLPDGKELKDEKLDVYDMQEYAGMDKAVLWAVRAVLCRGRATPDDDETVVKSVRIVAGYRCWHDNYHHTDDTRWHHRRETFHFGKTVEFVHHGKCADFGADLTKPPCPECEKLRKVALEKCGFQLRWHQAGRVGVAEGVKAARPPATPWAVHLSTVRRHERENDAIKYVADEFVKEDAKAIAPLYEGKVLACAFPLDLGSGLDPKLAVSEEFFSNTETGKGGWFPLGRSRLWHGGVHIYEAAGTKVHAIADGEIVACRVGEQEDKFKQGSRNFVLMKHTLKAEGDWKDKEFFSLYLHLDAGKPAADSEFPWRRQLFLMTKDHVEALAPCPLFVLAELDEPLGKKKRLIATKGLPVGHRAAVSGAEVDPRTLDDRAPADSKVRKVEGMTDTYVFVQREGKAVSKFCAADGALAAKFDDGSVIALQQPILICVSDELGGVAKAPTDGSLSAGGSFLHLETFSAAALPVAKDFVTVEATEAEKIAERKEVIAKLVAAKLLPQPLDGVLLESELNGIITRPPFNRQLRSAVLHMPSAWSFDWKDALKAKCFSFMKDDARDALAMDWNNYSWWKAVKDGKGKLPADEKVYHYHPIALILQLAYGS